MNTIEKLRAVATKWIVELLRYVKSLLCKMATVTGILLVLAGVMLLGVGGLSGCAQSVRLTAWEIPISEELRGCPKEKLPPEDQTAEVLDMLNDAQIFGLRQTMRVVNCEEKNQILLDLIEQHNKKVRELDRNWLERLFG